MDIIRIGLVAGFVGSGLALQLTESADAEPKEKVLYSFCSQQNCTDGATPMAGMFHRNGMIFSTTLSGGNNDAGTVFAIDLKSGAEKVIYSFGSQADGSDGSNPMAGLIGVKGALYGTTTW